MSLAILLLPLIGGAIAGLLGKQIGDRGAELLTSFNVTASAVLSWIVFSRVTLGGEAHSLSLFTWMDSGALEVEWALRVDQLTAVMLVVVTTVSAMVHIYSIGYMHHDTSRARFFSYLSLFTFFMLMLVTSDNLVQMFFGWEGVGLASYLLIGFWYDRPSANAAAIKAFIVNRVGDFGFALGIAGVFLVFGSVDLDTIFAAIPSKAGSSIEFLGFQWDTFTTLAILLFIGAMGKSAQLGLHTWLPDAMEGPTPVSALIHAATMVTAGVFMVCRLSPLFEQATGALAFITVIGAATALFAATIGLVQNDIKRVIAYSTMSQLGYMFFAAGLSAYGAAMFHLFTHAFFKALLFLGAGSVIHAMSNEQDMQKMGGIWRLVPGTYALMWIGSLALAGIGIPGLFGFAGFYSKDIILETAWAAHSPLGQLTFWIGLSAAIMTGFYSWRLLFLTFHGKPRADEYVMAHVHESPPLLLLPLLPLALGAVGAGYLFYPYFVGPEAETFWGGALPITEGGGGHGDMPHWVLWAPTVAGGIGIVAAFLLYILAPRLPQKIAGAFSPLYRLFYNKWYVDFLYDRLFVQPTICLGAVLWKKGDIGSIDAIGPNGITRFIQSLAARVSALQSGYVYHYAFAILIGVVLLLSWYFTSNFWLR